MVKLRIPNPSGNVKPKLYRRLKKGDVIFRIFALGPYNPTQLYFRKYGPSARFDHHRGVGGDPTKPGNDRDRAIFYSAPTLSSCVVEVFGDTTVIVPKDRNGKPFSIAVVHLTRDLLLLDLRRDGAMKAGTVAAIAKCSHSISQKASRVFYENPSKFGQIDGLMYSNAHNDEDALALYERADDALECPSSGVIEITDVGIRAKILQIANKHLLTVAL
jgi:hypothetical protein